MKKTLWIVVCLVLCLGVAGLRARALPVWSREPAGYLALTFDDSPNGRQTERLLDGLKERGVHATFFVIGEQIEGQEALLRRMRDEGHQIGNHTWTHRRLDNSGAVGRQELSRTEAALSRVLGGSGYWVRPPWGFASPETLREARTPLLYWSLDTEDWRLSDADRVCRCIVEQASDGDVILLHDAYATSVEGALAAVDALLSKGYAFVTAEELFERMGVEPRIGCLYCRPDRLRDCG